MRKAGLALTFVGAFLVMLGVFASWVVPGALLKVPLTVDSVTKLAGTATLGDETFPVKVFNVTRIDSAKSDDKVASWVSAACVVKDEGVVDGCVSTDDPQNRLVNASTDVFATDRVTAEAVNDPKYTGPEAAEINGLVNKWPFDAQKKDYTYWEGTAGEAVPAKFLRAEKIDGLEVYVYEIKVENAKVEVADGVPGTYSTTKTITIEPLTGAPVNQQEKQLRITEDGETLIDLDIEFTDEQRKKSVDESKEQVAGLKLITGTLPKVGFGLGIPLLIGGIALLVVSNRRKTA